MSATSFSFEFPDSAWITDVSAAIADHGAIAAGVLFIAIALSIFVATLALSRTKRILGISAAALCLLTGVAFLLAGINSAGKIGYQIVHLQRVPVTFSVASSGEDTFVNQGLVDGCLRDIRIAHLNPNEAIRFRISPLYSKVPKFLAGTVCSKFQSSFENNLANYYAVPIDLLRTTSRITYILYNPDDDTLLIEHDEIDKTVELKPIASNSIGQPSHNNDREFALIISAAYAQSVEKNARITFWGIMSLFATGDFSEIWNGVDQLSGRYNKFSELIMSSLFTEKISDFQTLGLLLTIRRHYLILLDNKEKIPKYKDKFVKRLLELSRSEDDLLRSNARILLRTQPTNAILNEFERYFEETPNGIYKKRTAGIGADLYYNNAMDRIFVDSAAGNIADLEFQDSEHEIRSALDNLDTAWGLRKWKLPQDEFLYLKALYGKGLVLTLLGIDIMSSGVTRSAFGTGDDVLRLAEATFAEFIDNVQGMRKYQHPAHISVAESCQLRLTSDWRNLEMCLRKNSPR